MVKMKEIDSKTIQDSNLRFYWFIVIAYATFQLISDVTAGKIIAIGPAVVSATVLYFPITYVISDVLTEVYGYERARRALWSVMAASVAAGLIYQLVVVLPPGPGFEFDSAYRAVLGQVPRILVAGWIAVLVGDLANNFVMSKLKIATNGRFLWMRAVSSTVVGQGLNTAIFYVGALWGVLPTNVLVSAILWGWLIKVMVEAVLLPVTYVVVARLKKAEGFDAFDFSADYSPMKV